MVTEHIVMQKYKFSCPVVKSKLKDYKSINQKLLKFFESCEGETVDIGQGYRINDLEFPDSFSKLDWRHCNNYDREWVKYFLPLLESELTHMIYSMSYQGIKFRGIWFQQYKKHNTHGWHTHAENFTGVYYVQLDKKSPNTEIVDPFNNRKIRRMDVEEGDLIFFPSFFIHRAPPLLNDTQKTIVSFNFNVTKPIESSYKNFYHADYFTRIRKRLGWC